MLAKKLICLAVPVVLASCSLAAETQGGGPSASGQSLAQNNPLEAEVRELVQRWAEAFRRNDLGFVERIIAPDFMLVSSANGRTEFSPREEWLSRLSSVTHLEYSMSVVHLVTAGETAVASVEGHRSLRTDDGNVRSFRFVATDTWVKQRGQWQVLSRHSHPVPEAASR